VSKSDEITEFDAPVYAANVEVDDERAAISIKKSPSEFQV
jgi:hypothetical protein